MFHLVDPALIGHDEDEIVVTFKVTTQTEEDGKIITETYSTPYLRFETEVLADNTSLRTEERTLSITRRGLETDQEYLEENLSGLQAARDLFEVAYRQE